MFFGGDFQLWKLHTLSDYMDVSISIIFLIVCARIGLYISKKRRTAEQAKKRTAKMLKKVCKKDGLLLPLPLELPNYANDYMLLLWRGTIYILRIFHWGTRLIGKATEKQWKLVHASEVRTIVNPLIEMEKDLSWIRQQLSGSPLQYLEVAPLIILADNFSPPILSIDNEAKPYVITYYQLKRWLKSRPDQLIGPKCTHKEIITQVIKIS
ncbi:hypothetical protein B5E43_10375 [Flavonifractor sp. An100]|nr:hypothetical protein B5E43_10375 [Flavonifractor sp. An100]